MAYTSFVCIENRCDTDDDDDEELCSQKTLLNLCE